MRRLAPVALAVAAVAVASACSAGGPASTAEAKVSVGGMTYRYAGGTCSGSDLYEVDIGTNNLPSGERPGRYFGVYFLDRPRDGASYTAHLVIVNWHVPGTAFHLETGRITLGEGLRRGSFSGTARIVLGRDTRLHATGSWTC